MTNHPMSLIDIISKNHKFKEIDEKDIPKFDSLKEQNRTMHYKPMSLNPLVESEQESDDSLSTEEDMGKDNNKNNIDHVTDSKMRHTRKFSNHEFNYDAPYYYNHDTGKMHLLWSNLKIKDKGWVHRDSMKFDEADTKRYVVKASE